MAQLLLRPRSRLTLAVAVLVGITAAGAAEAAPLAHHGAHDVHLASKIIAGTSRAIQGTAPLFGPGIDVEIEIGRGFEVEVASAVLLGSTHEGADHLTQVPVELVLKHASAISERAELFFGAGPAFNILSKGDHTDTAPGAVVLVGANLWQDHRTAILVEFSYQTVLESMVAHDVDGAVGVVYAF
jgi:hypothetical protein